MKRGSGSDGYEVTIADEINMTGSWSVVAGSVCIVNWVLGAPIALPGRDEITLG
jgi:hypothetical protein